MKGRRVRTWGVWAAGCALLLVALLLWRSGLLWFPDDLQEERIVCQGEAPTLPPDRALRVLFWNVQFAASTKHHFFYDGGKVVSVPIEDVHSTLKGIADVIQEADPDIVMLQEVDRSSRRTGYVDQVAALASMLSYPCHVSTPYFRVPYVPHPAHEHLGKMDMHLAVFSRFKMQSAVRVQLPLLNESWFRRIFNLRRAMLEVELPVADGAPLKLFNTHLSAFSMGDGTLERQVDVLMQRVATQPAEQTRWLLAGDLNALPPEDKADRLGDDARLYAEQISPIEPLFRAFMGSVDLQAHEMNPEPWRTYVPFGASVPDRVLDYAFWGSGIQQATSRVERRAVGLSDHLPVIVEFL
jgi:endonuclease/exonuclease/phosphatase family metal-dependent hydrolase